MSNLTTIVTIVIDAPGYDTMRLLSNGLLGNCCYGKRHFETIATVARQRLLSMIGILQWLFFEFLLPSNSCYGCRINRTDGCGIRD